METHILKPLKEDRRSRRTHRLLSEALVALLLEKRYDTITVQDIIDHANVGRSTFYAHYQDKEDLLQSELARVIAHMDQHMARSDAGGRIVPSYELFQHLQENYRLYTALGRGRAGDMVFKVMQASLRERVVARLAARPPADPAPAVPILLLANHVAGTLVILLQWWLENQMPYSPERLEGYFQTLIGPSLQAALAPGNAEG